MAQRLDGRQLAAALEERLERVVAERMAKAGVPRACRAAGGG